MTEQNPLTFNNFFAGNTLTFDIFTRERPPGVTTLPLHLDGWFAHR